MTGINQLAQEIKKFEQDILRDTNPVRHIEIDYKNYSIYLPHNGKRYIASPTGAKFHADTSLVKGVMGPVNSGKSTMHFMDQIFITAQLPKFKRDGVRRGRFGCIRNTYPDLKSTTLKSWMDWFEGFGDVPSDREKHLNQTSPFSFKTIFNDGKGWCELEVVFMALDKEKDIRKLDSMNFTGLFFNESRYIEKQFVERAPQRVRRYPDLDDLESEPLYAGSVTMDTNPPNYNHWWYLDFEEMRPSTYAYFKQPPGLIETGDGTYKTNPEAENIKYMAKDYYLNLAKSMKSKEEIKVQILNQYGISSDGEAVFPEYNHDIHCVENIELIDGPVYVGIDFGSTPAAVFGQVSPRGRLLVIKAITTDGGGLESMLENYFLPYCNTTLAGRQIICFVDPSGFNSEQSDGRNAIMMMGKHGFLGYGDRRLSPAQSNRIETRLDAVRGFFRRLIDGVGAVAISKQGAYVLIEGCAGKYKKKKIKTIYGFEYGDPVKEHIYGDAQDGFQYLCQGVGAIAEKPKESGISGNFMLSRIA